MTTTKLTFLTCAVLLANLLSATAGEFPENWYYDGKPEKRAAHAALEGHPMPSLAGLSEWLNGAVKANEIKGKVLVVDFYATWCGPCMAAVPHNNEMVQKHKSKGLVLLGVCTSSRGQEKFAANAKQYGMAYPIARDATEAVSKAWAVQSFPTYAVVDRKGIVRAVGLRPSRVDDVVKKLLEETAN